MEYLQNNSIKDFVIEQLIEKLREYQDTEHYGGDLGYELYSHNNKICGSKQWIKERFDDLVEVIKRLNSELGEEYVAKFNPFSEPDKFMLMVVTEVAYYLIGQCPTVQRNWDNKLKLTKANINKITKELESMKRNHK